MTWLLPYRYGFNWYCDIWDCNYTGCTKQLRKGDNSYIWVVDLRGDYVACLMLNY